jgi:DNA-binding MurR/RpiR family transcriptional regulator
MIEIKQRLRQEIQATLQPHVTALTRDQLRELVFEPALSEIERLEELLRPVRLLEAVESMAQNNRRIADAADRISGHLERMGFK